MPYIKLENRSYFEPVLYALAHSAISDPGELNFMFTELIKQYMVTHTKNYQTMNDIVGALESCKAEFQRRVVNPYEDDKITENGDVWFV